MADHSSSLRRHSRLEFSGTVRITWQDAGGAQKFLRGRCLDLSAAGIRVEVPEQIQQRTYVTVAADKIGLVTNASIRHVVRAGAKYVIGMEFSSPIAALDKLLKEERSKPLSRPAHA